MKYARALGKPAAQRGFPRLIAAPATGTLSAGMEAVRARLRSARKRGPQMRKALVLLGLAGLLAACLFALPATGSRAGRWPI